MYHNKRGQQTMGLPIGLIFSIFLIVVFIVVAFIAVSYFLDLSKLTGVGEFYSELQSSVDRAWSSQSSEFSFQIDLPSGIEKICFANLSAKITNPSEDYNLIEIYEIQDANVFLIPPNKAEGMPWKKTDHLNLAEITSNQNPYCVEVSKDLTIKKEIVQVMK
jgi:hypothetical protein